MEKPKLIIYGKVIALSDVQKVASNDASSPAMKKQMLYLDCTRYDSITGERSGKENKPLLEFGGDKVVDKIAELKLQKDDVVCVSFVIQGTPYKDKNGKPQVFTAIRCYDIEVVRRAGQQAAPAPTSAPATQQAQTTETSKDGKDGLPF